MKQQHRTVQGAKGTVRIADTARHTGLHADLTPREWAAHEGCRYVIRPGRHKGPRKYVDGYELAVGARGYVFVFATAHKASDLFARACAAGLTYT